MRFLTSPRCEAIAVLFAMRLLRLAFHFLRLPARATHSADKSNFGFKMLEKMGWAEGKGLGRKEDGMSTHVRVKRRTENLG